jgi:hypothetical protein
MTDDISSDLTKLRVGNVFSKIQQNVSEISNFSEFVFDEGKTIANTINSKQKNFDDFREILVKSTEFKKWLFDVNPDHKLLKAYHDACLEGTWADKLPGKSFRFALYTAAGLALEAAMPSGVGTLMGIGLSASDTFLFDKLIHGWKPSQFVQGLTAFVK